VSTSVINVIWTEPSVYESSHENLSHGRARESCGNCGKLVANYAPSFPQFPQLLRLSTYGERGKERKLSNLLTGHVTSYEKRTF
jgi:hypothetical protein